MIAFPHRRKSDFKAVWGPVSREKNVVMIELPDWVRLNIWILQKRNFDVDFNTTGGKEGTSGSMISE